MNQPSIKTLNKAFPGKGKELRFLIDGGPTRGYKSVQDWEAQCHHVLPYRERRMCAINEVIEGYGVEYLRAKGKHPSYEYINMGDTYTTTLLCDEEGRFCVASIGDIVEKHMGWYE